MRRILQSASLAAATLCLAAAQSTPPAFEVASVKPTTLLPGGGFIVGTNGGPGTGDPGRIHYVGVPLTRLLIMAYGVKEPQISGPDWLNSERYDLTAKLPDGSTRAQLALMMQGLLEERFGLKLHRETKTLSVYVLTVAKGGPKLKESPESAPTTQGVARHGNAVVFTRSSVQMTSTHQPMSQFADDLSRRLGNQVIDQTGLQGAYDFTVEWTIDPASPPDGGAASLKNAQFAGLFAALQQQAGLRLETRKSPVEMLVIDHVAKVPTAN